MYCLAFWIGFTFGCDCGEPPLPSQDKYLYRFGCGSGGVRCQRVSPDGAGPVYDYRREFDYPWRPYRRAAAAAPPGLLVPHAALPSFPEAEPEIIRLEE